MLDSPSSGPTAPAEPAEPAHDDARDRSAAAAPLDAVRAVVRQLDQASSADETSASTGPSTGAAAWRALVVALRARAAELAHQDAAAWRLAVGSAVLLEHWTAGEWATRLREALLDDGFTRPRAALAVEVVAVHLQRTCPASASIPGGPGASDASAEVGSLSAYPVLQRLRPQLSADVEDAPAASHDALVAQVAALRA